MGCHVYHRQLLDSVTETSFGPICASDEEAEQLRYHAERIHGFDPRILDKEILEWTLEQVRAGKVGTLATHKRKQCGCGSGKAFTLIMSQSQVTKTQCSDGHDWVEAPNAGWL